jgi:ELWxxDGT repeat protein
MITSLYFNPATSDGIELWKTDGTTGGTLPVKDINSGINSSNPFF